MDRVVWTRLLRKWVGFQVIIIVLPPEYGVVTSTLVGGNYAGRRTWVGILTLLVMCVKDRQNCQTT